MKKNNANPSAHLISNIPINKINNTNNILPKSVLKRYKKIAGFKTINNVNKNKENQNLEVDLTFKIFNQKDVDNTIVSPSDCYINSG